MDVTKRDLPFLCGVVAYVALAAQIAAPKAPGDWYGAAGFPHPQEVQDEAFEWMGEPVDRLILEGTSWHARADSGDWVKLDAKTLELEEIGFGPENR